MAVPMDRMPLAKVLHRIRVWENRRTTSGHCDSRELQRVLHDLNLSESDLGDAVNRGASPELLAEMLQALGIDAQRLKWEYPSVEADLRRVCAQCSEVERCRRELDACTAASDYHEFCYNAVTLESLLPEAGCQMKCSGKE